MRRRIRLGELKIEGDHGAVEALVLRGSIPITYDYIATLMRTPNAFGEGPACIVCHSSHEQSDHPNTSLLMRWIQQGAWCR